MANTVIQLKHSTITATPPSLNVAEPAYSYVSNTFFIGSPTGTGVIPIGGKFYLDQQQNIYNLSNAAFNHANSAFIAANNATDLWVRGQANAAFEQANAAFSTANGAVAVNLTQNNSITAAFSAANSAASAASAAQNSADAAFNAANGAIAVNLTQNTSITAAFAAANTADSKAVSAGSYANSAFATANNEAGVNATQNNSIVTASNTANAAFFRANNSLNANTGGQITGDVSITGNLSVLGNSFVVSASTIVANDTLIILGANNYTSDILDIGFAGHYNDGVNAHSGLIRDSGTKEWQLFEGYTPEIGANNQININDPSFKIATLNANVHATLIQLKGINLLPYVNSAYDAANTADAKAVTAGTYANGAFLAANVADSKAVTAGSYANSAFLAANVADSKAVSAGTYANGAFAAANTADSKAVSAGSYANSAFLAANTADNKATSAGVYANGAFAAANTADNKATSAGVYANGAFDKANTDVTNVSITAADYGTASAVASFRVEANGRISSANNTAIAIDAGAITSGTLPVGRGGTGAATFTTNGVLLGQGTSAFSTASSSTEGHVLTINASGVPTFAHLQGGTF